MKPLEILNLKKNYGSLEAVKGVSFQLEVGEIFGLLGPNGAGKTSIISVITTLEKPSSGSVKIFGHDVTEEAKAAKRKVGVVHQEVINSGFFDILEILEFQSGYYGLRNNSEQINYLLHKLGLHAHRHKKVKQLSGGMKRRLMIAKALVHKPDLLLLDEPTAGVDIELRENLWNFVRELQSQGLTILLTTHYLEEAEELCQRVGILNKGGLVCVEPPQKIIRNFTKKKIILELHHERQLKNLYPVKKQGNTYEILVPSEKNMGELLTELEINVSDLSNLRIEEGSLEEAFLSLVSNDKGLTLEA